MEESTSVSIAVWPHGAQPKLNVLPEVAESPATYVVGIPGISNVDIFFESRDQLEEWMETLRCLVVDTYALDQDVIDLRGDDPPEESRIVNIHDIVNNVSREFVEAHLGGEETKHCNKCDGTVTV